VGSILNSKISISILCGGQAKRFGQDKALYRVNGRPMLLQILDKFKPFSEDVFLQGAVNGFSEEANIYPDLVEARSPLGGIYSSLVNARYEKLFVVACDMPFVDVRILHELLEHEEHDIVVPRWRSGHFEPLCALYSKSLIPGIEAQIKEEDFKISKLFDNVSLGTLDIDELIGNGRLATGCFRNINRPEDLE
jgi:molybdopterin-guanine dinucleotide biosynthesis protein A